MYMHSKDWMEVSTSNVNSGYIFPHCLHFLQWAWIFHHQEKVIKERSWRVQSGETFLWSGCGSREKALTPGEGTQLRNVCTPASVDSCGWSVEVRLVRGERSPGDLTDSFCQSPRETMGFWPSQWHGIGAGTKGMSRPLGQAPNSQVRSLSLHTLVRRDLW